MVLKRIIPVTPVGRCAVVPTGTICESVASTLNVTPVVCVPFSPTTTVEVPASAFTYALPAEFSIWTSTSELSVFSVSVLPALSILSVLTVTLPAVKLAPVTAPVASTLPPVVILPPATLPVAVTVVLAVSEPVSVIPAVVRLPAVTLPENDPVVALAIAPELIVNVPSVIVPAVVKLPPVMLPVTLARPAVIKLPPVMLPVATTCASEFILPPSTLPLKSALVPSSVVIVPVAASISPAVIKLPPVMLPVAVIVVLAVSDPVSVIPAVVKLPPVMFPVASIVVPAVIDPVASINPPVIKLPPVMLPVATIVVPAVIPFVIAALSPATWPAVVKLPPLTLPVAVIVVPAVILVVALIKPSEIKFPPSIFPLASILTTSVNTPAVTLNVPSVIAPLETKFPALIFALNAPLTPDVIAPLFIESVPSVIVTPFNNAADSILPPSIFPVTSSTPERFELTPSKLPVTVRLSPLATPIFGVVKFALSFTITASPTIAVVTSSTLTSRVSPVFDKPSPATIEPAPENCVKLIAVDPIVTGAFVVQTKPASALVVPSSMNVKPPGISLAGEPSKSPALVSTKAVPASPTVVTT